MSLAGHLESDPKGKGFPWKHSSDVRPQKRPSGQVRRRLLNKTPQQSQFCIPKGEKSKGGREVAKNGAKGTQLNTYQTARVRKSPGGLAQAYPCTSPLHSLIT